MSRNYARNFHGNYVKHNGFCRPAVAFVVRENEPAAIRSLAKSIRRGQWPTTRDDRRCAFANCLLCINPN